MANRGRGSDFSLFAESKLESRIQQRGGHVLELPALPGDAMARIDAYDKAPDASLTLPGPREEAISSPS